MKKKTYVGMCDWCKMTGCEMVVGTTDNCGKRIRLELDIRLKE